MAQDPVSGPAQGLRRRRLSSFRGVLVAVGVALLCSLAGPSFVAAPDRTVAVRGTAHDTDGSEERHGQALVGIATGLAPSAAGALVADSLDSALHPWFSVSPVYGAVLYVIALIVQRLKFEYYNYVYMGAAVLWLGPAVILFLSWKWDPANNIPDDY
mmetsp:Transcript_51166/g.95904  ORF Transcript_51166/g.95904 Transcript_51166/m.95904 type:complete len:157 (-) Transcript_51166:117-587(-)